MAEPMTKLKEMRKERGWTQQYLAYELHTTRQAVNAWENGVNSPTMKSIKRLTEVFGCSVQDLID